MATVNIEVLDKQVKTKMQDLQNATSNVTPAMQVVGRKVKTKVQLGFRTGRDPWNSPWKPLNTKLTRAGSPLRNTGRLMQSITYALGGTTKEQHVDIGTSLKSNGVLYPAVHQFGAVITPKSSKYLKWMGPNGLIHAKKVTIPARPFLPLKLGGVDMPEQWTADVLVALRNHFDKAVKA